MLTREECLVLCISTVPITEPDDDAQVVDQWCWHCCHTIPGMVIPLPVAYDDRKHSYTYMGQFCSWGCAKGYALDLQRMEWGHLLAMLKRQVIGKRCPTVPAPPRRCLQVFGGSMTLEEFRSKSNEGIIVGQLPRRMMERLGSFHTLGSISGRRLDHNLTISFLSAFSAALRCERHICCGSRPRTR